MRLTTVLVPKGFGKKVSQLALKQEIPEVALSEARKIQKESESQLEKVEFQTNAQKTKHFLRALMESEFYDPKSFSFSTRHPESSFSNEPPEEETYPLIRYTGEVYQELWQFSQVTRSLVCRVFLTSILIAFGVKENYMPLIIAGLLFLPYHHFLIGMGIGASTKEWKLAGRSVLAFLVSTLLIALAAVVIGLLTKPGIKFTQFTETSLFFNVILSAVIGAAAGFGSVDDAGRRELIGLAATAHLAVYPVWFGLKFVYGFNHEDKPWESLGIFLVDTFFITLFALAVLKLMKMKGKEIRRFVKASR